MASLRRYGRHHCGAAILNDRWAATAAHCFYRFQTDIFTLYTGTSDIFSGGLIHELELFIFHEEYSPITLSNDIAMVKVQNIINFDRTTLPVPLPDINFILNPGDKARVTGWGYTSESGPLSITLLAVDLLIVGKSKCSESYRNIRNLTDAMFCAGFDEGEKDACQGDSGGPLVSKGVLVGIVSWGRGCGRPDLPGVYAKVSHFNDWISQQMGTISTF